MENQIANLPTRTSHYYDREHSPVREPGARINQHANGNEEERNKSISNGKSLRREFMCVIGAAEKQAGDKRSKCERQTNRLRDRGDNEANGERQKKGNFIIADFFHASEQPWNDLPAGIDNWDK